MKTLYESPFLRLGYYKPQKLVEAIWLSETAGMTEIQYQKVFTDYLVVLNQNPPAKLLIDERQMLFTVNPDLQLWVTDMVKQELKWKLEKIAIVVNSDLIQQLAAEQLMQESDSSNITITQFFEEKENAIKWLTDPL
ncbi:hypothetical protein [Flexithrix dorotheae]|uniref:hypothetical protein n=1 Tax=Flexithrix dorotheae TaxID=70993 RepID=UPI00037F34FF|nr:hypothetical protein [Flexithrix dorotheae]